jgi:hypothetical protein
MDSDEHDFGACDAMGISRSLLMVWRNYIGLIFSVKE